MVFVFVVVFFRLVVVFFYVVVLFQSSNAPLSSFSPFFFVKRRTNFLESKKEAKKTFVRNMLRVGFRVFSLGTYLTP